MQDQRDQSEQRAEHVDGVLEVDGHDRRIGALIEKRQNRHAINLRKRIMELRFHNPIGQRRAAASKAAQQRER